MTWFSDDVSSCMEIESAEGVGGLRRVLWSRVVSGRGKFESEWSVVARVVRVVRVAGVVGIGVLFSENGVPVNG